MRKEALGLLKEQSSAGNIDLFFGDEVKISQNGYVPYGWQFEDEEVSIPSCSGQSRNIFGLFSRENQFHYKISEGNITAEFVRQILDDLSFRISKMIVIDNAAVHTAKIIKESMGIWEERGLYIFYLPPYSPQLNLIERLWKEIKQSWIKPRIIRAPTVYFTL